MDAIGLQHTIEDAIQNGLSKFTDVIDSAISEVLESLPDQEGSIHDYEVSIHDKAALAALQGLLEVTGLLSAATPKAGEVRQSTIVELAWDIADDFMAERERRTERENHE